jgi:hypothetical protein
VYHSVLRASCSRRLLNRRAPCGAMNPSRRSSRSPSRTINGFLAKWRYVDEYYWLRDDTRDLTSSLISKRER